MTLRKTVLAAPVAAALLAAAPSWGANAQFQAFFFSVCQSPTGTLTVRCAETPSGQGNLSGDSESSLNPSQNLSHNLNLVSSAQGRSDEARERGENLREGQPSATDGVKVDVGPFSLLLNIHGAWFDATGDESTAEREFDGDSSAAEIGLDYRLNDRAVIGGFIGFERSSYDFVGEAPGSNFVPASSAGSAEADDLYLTLFANWQLGSSGFIELSGGYEDSDGEYRRNSVFQESSRTVPQTDVRVLGEAGGATTWIGVNGGLDLNRGAFNFGPYAGLTQTSSSVDAYAEKDLSGSGLAMRFAETEQDSLLGHVGIRGSYAASTATGVLVPQLRAEYLYEFEDDPVATSATYLLDASGNSYSLAGGEPDTDWFNLGASLALLLPNGWMAFADVSVLLDNDDQDRTRATLGLRKEF